MISTRLTKSILRTTDNYIKALEKAGVLTVGDLLNHFPREYDDRTEVLNSFSLINVKEKNTILVKLLSINSQKTAGNKLLTKAVLEDNNGFLSEAVWFNRKFLGNQLKGVIGKKVIASGKVKYAFGKITFQSPDIETDLGKVGGEIVPIYPDLNYIPSKWTQPKIELLKSYFSDITEILPGKIIEKYDFISRKEAYYKIHFPKNNHDIEIAKHRLAYEELYEINYKALSAKYAKFEATTGKSMSVKMNPDTVKDILTGLPFDLTDHQKIVLFQVLKDMEKDHGMQRLLEGDVGTGKTAVAQVAAIHAILESEKQGGEEGIFPLEDGRQTSLLGEGRKTSPLGEGWQTSVLVEDGQTSPPAPLLRGEGGRAGDSVGMRENYMKVPDYVKEITKTLRIEQTKSEELLWDILRNKQLHNLKFRRQHPFGRYIADFYCDELKLVIELDGVIHEKTKEYDTIRDDIIKTYGVTILRFKNEEILNNLEKSIEKIASTPSPLRRGLGGGCSHVGLDSGCSHIELDSDGSKIKSNCSKKNPNGKIQVAIMAPTEILARQHFEGMQELFIKHRISSHLLVGSTTAKQKRAVKEDLKNGNIDVVIGTHALVQEDVLFHNLGFVIIDEQHRFGVKQREVLETGLGNRSGLVPHSLNMTATPIPRTLALTLYGDQDLSIISQYPKGRKEIYTKVARTDSARHQIELFVRTELEKGRQVFWISPLVEESEKMDLANAISTYETLSAVFEPFAVGLLHGKMKSKEKEQIMKDFSDNKIQVLSSTSVVEVGVNIPNATIMCIEGAERFGLSQLHQFRGRVGRGADQSYCYLFPSKGNSTDRLKAMENSNNGFELAEVDLELRGPGEVYGLRQSGVPDLKVADLRDLELISQIREDIEEMFENK